MKRSAMETLQVRLTEDLIKMVDRLVERGIYSSRSEAVRDAVRKLVVESEIGSLAANKTEKASVELVKEVRRKVWRECLEEAGGDKEKALRILDREVEGLE
ncbi:MAG: ribbon-helix-helix domain-containing protein [Candidatus Bathyarchaeia archaeon]